MSAGQLSHSSARDKLVERNIIRSQVMRRMQRLHEQARREQLTRAAAHPVDCLGSIR